MRITFAACTRLALLATVVTTASEAQDEAVITRLTNDYLDCVQQAAARLDDNVSDVNIVAKYAVEACQSLATGAAIYSSNNNEAERAHFLGEIARGGLKIAIAALVNARARAIEEQIRRK